MLAKFKHFVLSEEEEVVNKEDLTNIARGQIPEEWGILFADGDQDIPYNNIDGLQVRLWFLYNKVHV